LSVCLFVCLSVYCELTFPTRLQIDHSRSIEREKRSNVTF
jgi:hypothetical protein